MSSSNSKNDLSGKIWRAELTDKRGVFFVHRTMICDSETGMSHSVHMLLRVHDKKFVRLSRSLAPLAAYVRAEFDVKSETFYHVPAKCSFR